jgi:hypothetical protein
LNGALEKGFQVEGTFISWSLLGEAEEIVD